LNDSVVRLVLYVLVVVAWVYAVDVRVADYRVRCGLDVHVFFFFVLVFPWLYVVLFVVVVSCVACVAVVRCGPTGAADAPIARTMAAPPSDHAVECNKVVIGGNEDDLELLKRAKMSRSLGAQ
jgi:hypothetical protein